MRIWSAVCGFIWVARSRAKVGHSFGVISPKTPPVDSVCDEWTAWIPPSTEPAIVMQAVSIGFMPMEKNFIRLMEANSRFSRENIYLLCLDEKSELEVEKMGFHCVSIVNHCEHDIQFVWKLRVKVLSCLLEAGHNVIISDSDALWLKDPLQDLESPLARGSGIVASRGNGPEQFRQRWGSALCMGFILFRAGPCMETVLASINQFVVQTGSDQASVNFALDKSGVKWEGSSDMAYTSTEFSRGMVGNGGECDLNVTLLPHNKYTRFCKDSPITPTTVVAHCRAKQGNSAVKTEWMVEASLWDVDDDVV